MSRAWEPRCTATRADGHRCTVAAVEGVLPRLCGIHHQHARKRGLTSITLPERRRLIEEALRRRRA